MVDFIVSNAGYLVFWALMGAATFYVTQDRHDDLLGEMRRNTAAVIELRETICAALPPEDTPAGLCSATLYIPLELVEKAEGSVTPTYIPDSEVIER